MEMEEAFAQKGASGAEQDLRCQLPLPGGRLRLLRIACLSFHRRDEGLTLLVAHRRDAALRDAE